jgi:hypothetical protein
MSDQRPNSDQEARAAGGAASRYGFAEHWRRTFGQLFDPHPSHVAMVGLDGTVLAVNAAWRGYASTHGVADRYEFVGQNYLSVCEAGVASGLWSAQAAYVGLLGVLRSGRPKFTMTYPCNTPARREVYRMWVEPQTPSVPAVIVAHQPVESRPWTPDEAADLTPDGPPPSGAMDAATDHVTRAQLDPKIGLALAMATPALSRWREHFRR